MSEELLTKITEETNKNLIGKPNIEITEDEKVLFFKSFISDKPFELPFELFAGKMKISLHTLNNNELVDVFNYLKIAHDTSVITNDMNYFTHLSICRLGLCLSSINGEPFLPDAVKSTNKENELDYVKDRVEEVKRWPAFKVAALVDVLRTFEFKIESLTKEVNNPNFWIAVQ